MCFLVPPSDASDTDDHDSVHSLPVGSTRKKVSAPTHSVSSGHTPQASYADIARHAAALYTQQAGQQQHAVYREQLQFRYDKKDIKEFKEMLKYFIRKRMSRLLFKCNIFSGTLHPATPRNQYLPQRETA